jgi:hypothetical protein
VSPRTVPLPAVLVAAAEMFAAAAAAGCGGTKPEGADPGSPRNVVQDYPDRLSSGDRTGAAELLTRRATERWRTNRLRRHSWFLHAARVPVSVSMSNGRHDAQAVSIWTDFTRVGETDPTLTDSHAMWDFTLVKENPGDPWRIDDQGLG